MIFHPFLKFSLLGIFILLLVNQVYARGRNRIDSYTTSADRKYNLQHQEVQYVRQQVQPMIYLHPEQTLQQMEGFGAAITGSSAYNLMQMTPEDRHQFLLDTFSPQQGAGHSYIRVPIGCSDFSLSEYTCCDTPGIENFALTGEETEYIIPVLKEILAINPAIKIMGSPWTCPKWMKVSDLESLQPYDSWTGGQLNPACYADYGTYFVNWIKAFEKEGIPVYSVTPQNEPLSRLNSASLYMGWKEQQAFVRDALGPQLRKAGLPVKIYTFDHNYDYDRIAGEEQYPLRIYEDPKAAGYLSGAAYHNYSGDVHELDRIHQARPDKELIFTEASIGRWNDGRNLKNRLVEDMNYLGIKNIENWCNGIIVWNLMLDSDGAPNREKGCQSCYGAVDIDNTDYKTITRNSHFYVISHLSKVVQPGAYHIVGNGPELDMIDYCAFRNPDGSLACIVTNASDEPQQVIINDGKRNFAKMMPPLSVTSFKWR